MTFRLFLNYAGPIILQNVLSKEYLEHFNTFNCAIRILSDPTKYLKYNDYVKKLLIYFVCKFKSLYRENFATWNVHNIVHLGDDSKEFGPLDEYGALDIECFVQDIKRMIRKTGQQLQQINRR